MSRLKITCASFALFLVLLGWAISSPPGASPDDDYHLSSSYCAFGSRTGLCQPSNEQDARLIPTGLISLQNCYSAQSVPASCLEKNLENFKNSLSNSTRLNSNNFYPKLFYLANGLFVTSDVQYSVTITRLFNIAVVLLLFGIAYRYSDPRFKKVIPITIAVCSVPMGLFIFASNNPSSWSISSLFGYSFLLASIKTPIISHQNRRLVLPILLCIIAALGSRPDSVYLLPIISIGVCLFILEGSKFSTMNLAVLIPVISLGPAYSFLMNSKSQGFLKAGFVEGQGSINGVDILMSNLQSIPQFLFGGFGFSFSEVATRTGHLGWFNVPVPPTTSIIVLSVYLILISQACSFWTKAQKRTLIYFILIFILIAIFMHQKDNLLVGQFVQPRYLMVFIYLILGFSLVRENRPSMCFGAKVMFVAGLGVAHSLALYLVIKRYSVGYGDFGLSLNSGVQWWAFNLASPNTVWVVSSLAFALFLYFSLQNLYARESPKRETSKLSFNLRNYLSRTSKMMSSRF